MKPGRLPFEVVSPIESARPVILQNNGVTERRYARGARCRAVGSALCKIPA